MPELSIITVNFNNLEGLSKTMQSVFAQTFTDYEYIIVDGGSTDGSKEYIEKLAEKLSYWTSEPDGGIYQGMNKGIKFANGEYLLFLNSGDSLIDNNTISKASQILSSRSADIYYGNMQFLKNQHLHLKEYPEKLTLSYLARHPLNHQSSFIKRVVLNSFNGYGLTYKFANDHAFFLKAFVNGYKFEHIPFNVAFYDLNGVSQNRWELYTEEMKQIEKDIIPIFLAELLKEVEFYRKSRLIKMAAKLSRTIRLIRNNFASV